MVSPAQKRFITLRAVAAALVLLLGAITAPLALAARLPEGCAMACCVEQGHCCCNSRSGHVEDRSDRSKATFTEAEIYAPCPEGCASATASSSLQLRHIESALSHRVELGCCPDTDSPGTIMSCGRLASGASSPRAPPALSYFSA